MKNKKKTLLLFFSSLLFLALGSSNAKAAESSQCSGSCGDTQTCTGAAGLTASLKSQCESQFGAGSCDSMSSYLSQLESNCASEDQAILVAGDCSNISNGNRYGACAATYAGQLGSSGLFPVSDPNPAPGTTGGGWSIASLEGYNLPGGSIGDIIKTIANWTMGLFAFFGIIGFTISGIMYLISTGNEEMITKAKKYMTYSIVGVIVGLSGYVLIKAIDALLNAKPF